MQRTYKSKIIDIRLIKWGEPPAPLLPSSLRAVWGDESLPGNWVCAETGLRGGATVADLGVRVWETMEVISPRLRLSCSFLMRTRAKTVEKMKCVERVWPVGLKVGNVGWTVRTRNCLARKGLLDDEQRLVTLTFGDLFRIEGMGAMTALEDFCSTLESAIDIYEQLATTYAESRIEDKQTDMTSILEGVVHEVGRQISANRIHGSHRYYNQATEHCRNALNYCCSTLMRLAMPWISHCYWNRLARSNRWSLKSGGSH